MPSRSYQNLQELEAILNELFSENALAVLSNSELCDLQARLINLRQSVEAQRFRNSGEEEFADILAIFKTHGVPDT